MLGSRSPRGAQRPSTARRARAGGGVAAIVLVTSLVSVPRVSAAEAPRITFVRSSIETSTQPDQCVSATLPAPSVTVTGDPEPTVSFDPAFPRQFELGQTVVVVTATNGVAPDARTTFSVYITDRQLPRLAGELPDIRVPATSPAGAVVVYTTPQATDNCPGVRVLRSGLPSGSTFPIGRSVVSFRAVDASGNSALPELLTIEVTAPPTISLPPVVTVPAGPACTASNVTVAPTVTGYPLPTVTFSPSLAGPFGLGDTPVTATATNSENPPATTPFTVRVADQANPSITVPEDITVPATSGLGAVVSYGAISAVDNCTAPSIARQQGLASGAQFPIGTTTVTYRATDAAGNFAEDSFDVTVTGLPPTLSPIADITVGNAPNTCAASVAAPSTSTTGIPAPSVSFSPALPGTFPVGTTSVTATASNGATPDATQSFSVTVNDVQGPGITVSPNITVAATSPSGATVTYTAPQGSDNCPGVTTTRIAGPASGSTFPIGTTIVNFQAKDAANSTASSGFSVTVLGAVDQLDRLIAQVSTTPPGSSLASKLTEARTAFRAGRTADACRALNDFVNLVSAQRGKKLTRQQADSYLASARQIRAVIGC